MKKILCCLILLGLSAPSHAQQTPHPSSATASAAHKPSRLARAADKLVGAHDRIKTAAVGCKGGGLGIAKDLLLISGDLSLIGLKVTTGIVGAVTAVTAVVSTGGAALPIVLGLGALGAAALDNNDLVLNIPHDVKQALSRIKPICTRINRMLQKGCCHVHEGPQPEVIKKTFKEKSAREKASTIAKLPFKAVKKTGQAAVGAYDKVCRVIIDVSSSACGAAECINKAWKAIRDHKNAEGTLEILKQARCCDRAAAGGDSRLRKSMVGLCHDLGQMISQRRGGGSEEGTPAAGFATARPQSERRPHSVTIGARRPAATPARPVRPRSASF